MAPVKRKGRFVDGPSFEFSLIEALRILKPNTINAIKDRWTSVIFAKHGILESHREITWFAFVTRYPLALKDLQQKLKIRLLVVSSMGKQNKRVNLLYDGRYAVVDAMPERPLKCIWLDSNKKLFRCTDNLKNLPVGNPAQYQVKQFAAQQPLWKLLGCEDSNSILSENTNLMELKSYVQRHQPKDAKIVVKYATGLKRNSVMCQWFESLPLNAADLDIKRIIFILAFCDSHYRLAFAEVWDQNFVKAKRKGEKIEKAWLRYQSIWRQWKQQEETLGKANAHQSNCASAVSVSHTGLNLAYHLGLLTAAKLKELSAQLCQTQSTLYVFLDEKHHLRHITYYDSKATFCTPVPCFEFDCVDLNRTLTVYQQKLEDGRRSEAVKMMMEFWEKVWDRRTVWVQQRQSILQPLINHLTELLAQVQQANSNHTKSRASKQMTSPYLRCLNQLKCVVSRHRIYLYSKEDAHLHAIKFYLTHYAYSRFKWCRGLFLKAQSDENLMKMTLSGLTIFNLHAYLGCKQDVDFFASPNQPWRGPQPSQVIIQHAVRKLTDVKIKMDETETVTAWSFCRQYGWQWARHIYRYLANLNEFLLSTFGYDLQGQPSLPSTSYLAFQCIWTQYAQKSGPMAHSLERSKPYYEDLIRHVSRGGFMFSIGDSIQQGQPLSESEPQTGACSIAEFDLVSAYGYGAARAYIPSGFCVGYENLDKDGGNEWLERLDPKLRHRSFEFRAVYKIIDKLTRRQGKRVRSAYHNFSPLGLFTLGKYNLDLAIVFEDGKLLLLNLDGQWVHGCDTCPRKDTDFAYGQTHQQVRDKSLQRDEDIRAWVETVNAASAHRGGPSDWADYLVISDCHSPGYTPHDLKRSFSTEPPLQELIRGYGITEECGREICLSSFENVMAQKKDDPSFTFILRADVSVLQGEMESIHDSDGSFTLGPCILYEKTHTHPVDSPQDDSHYTLDGRLKRKCLRQRLAWEGNVVLTRDYYDWLKTTFGDRFELHNLNWILFYKTEPVINTIYRQLIELRSCTADPVLVTFLKKLVNLSAGFYGSRTNPLGSKTTYRLVHGAPRYYAFYRHFLDNQHVYDLGDKSYFLLETKPWPKLSERRPPSKSGVPLFLTIVEYGKLRLIQILHFLRQHLVPQKYRLLYSNIDNLILTLADPACNLDEAVRPGREASFRLQRPLYFTDPILKQPGLAECKWIRHQDPWTFYTLRTQHYCLSSEDKTQNLFKASGWSNVTTDQVVYWTRQLFQGQRVEIPQKRRTNKNFNLETRDVVLHC